MTRPTKTPGLFALRTADPQLNNWAQLVQETLELRNGSRGDGSEAAVTRRELDAVIARLDALQKPAAAADTVTQGATSAKTPPKADVTRSELAALRGQIDALQRQIQASKNGRDIGSFFEYVPATPAVPETPAAPGTVTVATPGTPAVPAHWRLKPDIWFVGSSMGDIMDVLFTVFFSDADKYTDGGAFLNKTLKVNNTPLSKIEEGVMNPMGNGLDIKTWTAYHEMLLQEHAANMIRLEGRIAALEAKP